MEERQACAKCLLRLLACVAESTLQPPEAEAEQPYAPLIRAFVDSLLEPPASTPAASPAPGGGGGAGLSAGSASAPPLLQRLIALLKDHSQEPAANTTLPSVTDEAGIVASRALLVQLERRILAKCLLLALFINQRALAPSAVAELLELLQVCFGGSVYGQHDAGQGRCLGRCFWVAG